MTLKLDDLRDGGTAQTLVNALDRVLIDLSSIAGTSPQLDTVIGAYVRWADAAAAELGQVMSVVAVEDWVYNDSHWRLREMPTSPQLPARDYLRLDLERRRRELTELRDLSRVATRRWAEVGDLIILDTNLLLDLLGNHGGSPVDIDWNHEISSRNDICLVIPLAILQELDKLKRGTTKVRSMAHAAIRWIDQHVPTDGRRSSCAPAPLPPPGRRQSANSPPCTSSCTQTAVPISSRTLI